LQSSPNACGGCATVCVTVRVNRRHDAIYFSPTSWDIRSTHVLIQLESREYFTKTNSIFIVKPTTTIDLFT